MENKTRVAFFIVTVFTSAMLMASCGRNKEGAVTKERNVPDSALTDSIPASGEDEYQQDEVPQGRTDQPDSIPDSTKRKRH